ncbi:hypothetical protein [Mesorhizobium sp. B4-1-4]|uniref:hypothetical protein n=1 Tax=Mesorhizobium sp. B4-1-4 TaxID=2589888 RepID=UPI0015E2C0C9|nr:hypothetical protein [Mesorhizobium sp. B4-1-4]UCI32539.1 hypothetical protein FJW03_03530 [Mesorhizobium sp. B4-1-4]
MKITIALLALVAYLAIADITYDIARHHQFEQPVAIGTAVAWPVFWVFMAGN